MQDNEYVREYSMDIAALEGAYRRQSLVRRGWRYGTLAIAFAAASAVGGGDIEKGTGAFFPVVFGSLFLNWSFFARARPIRWFGWLGLTGVGWLTTTVLATSAELGDAMVQVVSGAVAFVLAGGRLLLDRRFPDPMFWYNLGDKAEPY